MDITSWKKLHDKFYRKRELYSMGWARENLDLEQFMVRPARYGGPIALVRDDKKILLMKSSSVKPEIMIYSCSGELIVKFPWDHGSSRIIEMGWNSEELLVIVTEEGTVYLYAFDRLVKQFSFGSEVRDNKVRSAKIWASGIVILDGSLSFWSIGNFLESRPIKLADPNITEPPSCWTVLDSQFTLSKSVEVYCATQEGSILILDVASCSDQLISTGPFYHIKIAPNGKILCCFNAKGDVWVASIDFQKSISEFPTNSKKAPKDMIWCGKDSILLYWDKILLMVGPSSDFLNYSYEEPLVLCSEIDGARVISNSSHEFLNRLPESTESIFQIASTTPAAALWDAYQFFVKGSPESDENIRMIKNEGTLSSAVNQCIIAAQYEFDVELQQQLLRAAAFGKSFLKNYKNEKFMNACKIIRVLNSVNHYKIGVPLTYPQFVKITSEALIDRLIRRRLFLLALRVSEYLDLPTDRVLVQWACAKVQTESSQSNEELCDLIVSKLKSHKSISYSVIAATAHKAGKFELASMLLEYEPRSGDQVPLLLRMHQDQHALDKAIESGDTDLVYLVLLSLKRNKPQMDFFRIIAKRPAAASLFETFAKENEPELLKTFYFAIDKPNKSSMLFYQNAIEQKNIEDRIGSLRKSIVFYKQDTNRTSAFPIKILEDQQSLLEIQIELDKMKISRSSFIGLSIAETIYNCVLCHQMKRSLKIKSQFKVSDKQYYWAVLKALSSMQDWEGLESFAREKKSPIGYEPFVKVCMFSGASAEAEKYVPKLSDSRTQATYWLKMGLYEEAATSAIAAKDKELLLKIRSKTSDRSVQLMIDSHLK